MARDSDVRVEKLGDHWAVFVVEGGETTQKLFETKEFAASFAAGQRARLGLPVSRTLEGEAGIIDSNEM